MPRKRKISKEVEKPKGYRINDRRGTKEATLYPKPSNASAGSLRPRYYGNPVDTFKAVNQSERTELLRYSRELFCSLPNLGGAILAKASWSASEGWLPVFRGNDEEWGNKAEQWLVNKWFPTCNFQGGSFNWNTSLVLSSIALDVDGDSLMVYVQSKSGWPQLAFIPAHRIGNRKFGEQEITSGKFKGYKSIDGVILNKQGRRIGYNILGDNKTQDKQISVANSQFLMEPEFYDQARGIPKTSRALMPFLTVQDIDHYLKQTIKLEAAQGIMHYTEDGEAPKNTNMITGEDDVLTENYQVPLDPSTGEAKTDQLYMESLNGGEIFYMRANSGQKIESFKGSDRPSGNTEAFINRIERGCLYSIGWPIELIDSNKLNGTATRLVQDQTRKTIRSRQCSIEKRAKGAVAFAIAKAMEIGELPPNYDDQWYNFEFLKPQQLTVDNGYEAQMDREGLKIGLTTMSDVVAKGGKDWNHVRNQQNKEVSDLIKRAKTLSEENDISFEIALDLLSSRFPSGTPVRPDTLNNNNNTE